MSNNPSRDLITKGLRDLITPYAENLLRVMMAAGMDEDLAFTILEMKMKEEDFWQNPLKMDESKELLNHLRK